ncbi:hypothetical protein CFP56_035385 [Quercus suber]|uniref:Uncharacterized protein n=1 Tax=Quercus suber TaxID=58331 RepID=A0AAW0J9L2_QUESU
MSNFRLPFSFYTIYISQHVDNHKPILSQKKPIRTPSSSSPIATLHLDTGDASARDRDTSDTGVTSDLSAFHPFHLVQVVVGHEVSHDLLSAVLFDEWVFRVKREFESSHDLDNENEILARIVTG